MPVFGCHEKRCYFPFAMSTLRHVFAQLPAATGGSWSRVGFDNDSGAIPATILAAIKVPLPAGLKNRHCQKLEPARHSRVQLRFKPALDFFRRDGAFRSPTQILPRRRNHISGMIMLRDAEARSLLAFRISQGGFPDIYRAKMTASMALPCGSSTSGIGLIVCWFSKIAMPVKSFGLLRMPKRVSCRQAGRRGAGALRTEVTAGPS
jgi:hypothetical protein